jgi:NADPH:quinone reductase-like Zn-dependent oxidoreductase
MKAVKNGRYLLTEGTGGVSLFAVQLAKALGARVIATTSSPEKAERLRRLGADHVIDYRATKDWGE